jgi:hypothetical protein
MLYSLRGTYKIHGIHPFIYPKDVLRCIASHPINQIEMLLPDNWMAGGLAFVVGCGNTLQ